MDNIELQPTCSNMACAEIDSQTRIKIFGTVQKILSIAGIRPDSEKQTYLCNGRISTGFLLMGSYTISNVVYVFHVAKDFNEFTKSTYTCFECILFSSTLIIMVINTKQIFEYINGSEDLANTSE